MTLGAIGDKKLLIDVDSQVAELPHLGQKSQRVEHDPVADHRPAVGTQYPAGNQLKNKLLSPDDDGMPGVVAARIARHHRKPVRKNIDDLAFSLVAPLGAHQHCSLGSHERS